MNKITGHLVLLMAPSGSGKRVIMEGLGDLGDQIYFAKTYTSRPRRAGADENPKYVFVTEGDFKAKIEANEFVEWAHFSGNMYGTPLSEFLVPLEEGKLVFKEMELQGIQQIQKIIPKEHLTIVYIEAGGWDALKGRILSRSSMGDSELELRRLRYVEESKVKDDADVVISNYDGELEQAQITFAALIQDILSRL